MTHLTTKKMVHLIVKKMTENNIQPVGNKRQVTIRQWAAYYLQLRDPSPDGHRLQRLQRLFEVVVQVYVIDRCTICLL